MAKNDIITFPTRTVFNDTIQYKLDITYTGTEVAGLTYYTPSQVGLNIKDYGSSLIDFEVDSSVLIPSEITVTFNDIDGYLDNVFFNYTVTNCVLKLYRNGVEEFSGKFLKNPIDLGSEKDFQITFTSSIDVLNITMVRDQEGTYLYPLDVSDIKSYNPEGTLELIKVKDLIQRAYEFVNPNVDFDFSSDWVFKASNIYVSPSEISGITFDNLYTTELAFYYNQDSLADCLKKMCKIFFGKTGMPSNNKAFFRKLYYYDSSNLQTLDVKSRRKSYKYDTVSYLSANDSLGTRRLQLPTEEAYTLEQTSKIETDYYGEDFALYALYNNKTYTVSHAKDSNFSTTYYVFAELNSRLMYSKRSQMKYNREDIFSVKGTDIDYQKNFNYDGSKYEISTLEKMNAKGYTNINALYLGEI